MTHSIYRDGHSEVADVLCRPEPCRTLGGFVLGSEYIYIEVTARDRGPVQLLERGLETRYRDSRLRGLRISQELISQW